MRSSATGDLAFRLHAGECRVQAWIAAARDVERGLLAVCVLLLLQGGLSGAFIRVWVLVTRGG